MERLALTAGIAQRLRIMRNWEQNICLKVHCTTLLYLHEHKIHKHIDKHVQTKHILPMQT